MVESISSSEAGRVPRIQGQRSGGLARGEAVGRHWLIVADTLYNGFERVALDPPESEAGELDGLVSVSKREFVELLVRRVHPLCSRPAKSRDGSRIQARRS